MRAGLLRAYAVAVTFALLASLAWIAYRTVSERRSEAEWAARLRREQEGRRYDLAKLRQETAEVARLGKALADARSVLAQAADGSNPFEDAVDTWLDQVNRLSTYLGQHPEFSIPELRYLTANDWLDATKGVTLVTEADYRKALAALRQYAKRIVAPKIRDALRRFVAANNGALPPDPQALASYLSEPLDPAILQRYSMNPSGKLPGLLGDQPLVLVEAKAVDPLWDSKFFFSSRGEIGYYGTTVVATDSTVAAAIEKYRQATGAPPTDAGQIAPYLQREVTPALLNAVFKALTTIPPAPSGGR